MIGPVSLVEATRMFSEADYAHDRFPKWLWADGVFSYPEFKGAVNYNLASRRVVKCPDAKMQLSGAGGGEESQSPEGVGFESARKHVLIVSKEKLERGEAEWREARSGQST